MRSSAGSLFHVPVARERDIKGVLGQLRAAGLSTLATTMNGNLDLTNAGDALNKPTAWLFGNEAHGLPDDVLAAADDTASIPIKGSAESLNLSTAASICLWESAKALRER